MSERNQTAIKVLVLFSTSELGGAERSLTRMALQNRGIAGNVVFELGTLGGPGPWSAWVTELGVSPLCFGARGCPRRRGGITLRSLYSALHHIRRNGYHAIYVIGWRASVYLRLLNFLIPHVRLVQGVRWNPNRRTRLDRAFCFGERILGAALDGYIVNSVAAARTLTNSVGIPPRKVTVIYNGIDPPNEIPAYLQRPMNILTVANLLPGKGYLQFLVVVSKVIERVPSARFIFVGQDRMDGALQREVTNLGLQDVVQMTGFQSNVAQFYKDARVYAFPSLHEGAPTSILEAMGFSIPVVAYAVDGIPELVSNREEGILITPGDVDAMTNAIVDFLSYPESAERIGRSARSRVTRDFSLDTCAQHHEKYFSSLCASSSPA